MSDKSLILMVPEELYDRAQAAHLDLQQILIEALEQKFPKGDDDIVPSNEDIEAAIQRSLQRIASGETDLRVLGLNAGTSWVGDDFDDALPDEFWLKGDP